MLIYTPAAGEELHAAETALADGRSQLSFEPWLQLRRYALTIGGELGHRPLRDVCDVWFRGCLIPALFCKCCSLDFVRQSYLQRRMYRSFGLQVELEITEGILYVYIYINI